MQASPTSLSKRLVAGSTTSTTLSNWLELVDPVLLHGYTYEEILSRGDPTTRPLLQASSTSLLKRLVAGSTTSIYESTKWSQWILVLLYVHYKVILSRGEPTTR